MRRARADCLKVEAHAKAGHEELTTRVSDMDTKFQKQLADVEGEAERLGGRMSMAEAGLSDLSAQHASHKAETEELMKELEEKMSKFSAEQSAKSKKVLYRVH